MSLAQISRLAIHKHGLSGPHSDLKIFDLEPKYKIQNISCKNPDFQLLKSGMIWPHQDLGRPMTQVVQMTTVLAPP